MTKESLSKSLGLKDHTAIKILEHGLLDSLGAQSQLSNMYNAGMTLKTFRNLNDRLRDALVKVATAKGNVSLAYYRIEKVINELPSEYLCLMDAYSDYSWVLRRASMIGWNFASGSAFAFLARSLSKWCIRDRTALALGLLEVVNYQITQINEPGKGCRRMDAKKYIAGIRNLEWWFKSVFPNKAVSHKEGTLFYLYVLFWMRNYMNIDIRDPSRHIKAFIADKKNWMPCRLILNKR